MPISFNPSPQEDEALVSSERPPVDEIIASCMAAIRLQCSLSRDIPSTDDNWTTQQRDACILAVREYSRRLDRVTRVAGCCSREAQRNAFRHALTSFDGRLLAAVRVASHGKRFIPYEKAVAEAEQTTFEARCTEPVLADVKHAGGKQRLIMKPGPSRRAMQLGLRDVLRAGGIANQYEYSRKGLGPFAACAAIEAAIRNGYVYWLVYDIQEYFSSVKPEHLSWIPLRSHHLLNGAYIPDEAPICRSPNVPDCTTRDCINQAARRGLPLGSMASPQLASALHGRILQGLPGDLARLSYMDDGAIGARSLGEIQAIEKTLPERLASLSAGPLMLKFAHVYSALQGVHFLQFRIRPEWTDPAKMVVCPSPRAFIRFRGEVLRRRAAGASDTELNDYAIRWAQSNQWLGRALDDDHEDNIRDLLSMSIDEIVGW